MDHMFHRVVADNKLSVGYLNGAIYALNVFESHPSKQSSLLQAVS